MATSENTPSQPPPDAAASLRLSRSLMQVPPDHAAPRQPSAAPPVVAPVAAAPAAIPAATPAAKPATTAATPDPAPAIISSAQGALASRLNALRQASADPGLLPLTLSLGGIAVITTFGWLLERRRTRHEQDSVLWAGVQPAASSLVTKVNTLDDILPDNPNPAESARAIYVTAIGETNSRREATLIDLHQLEQKLRRRTKRGDHMAALLLLQQHLVDFRYTSPWVFLELRELYLQHDRQKEWDVARDAFRARFGQNAPAWTAPSTAGTTLADDTHLADQLVQQWPFRAARMWILRWMLGEPEMRARALGPPLLPLGIYRDFMLLDNLLDDVMSAPPAQDSPQ